jgi:hypothetical protein
MENQGWDYRIPWTLITACQKIHAKLSVLYVHGWVGVGGVEVVYFQEKESTRFIRSSKVPVTPKEYDVIFLWSLLPLNVHGDYTFLLSSSQWFSSVLPDYYFLKGGGCSLLKQYRENWNWLWSQIDSVLPLTETWDLFTFKLTIVLSEPLSGFLKTHLFVYGREHKIQYKYIYDIRGAELAGRSETLSRILLSGVGSSKMQ